MNKVSFEDIFAYPEPYIQDILRQGNQESRDYLTNRYVATVLIANSGLLNANDYRCATNQQFQQLYLDDTALMQANLPRTASRFDRLRNLLGCERIIVPGVCDAATIRLAINRYGKGILRMHISDLNQEFGNAFNINHIMNLARYIYMMPSAMLNQTLSEFIFNFLRENVYDSIEAQDSQNPSWIYMKCLLRVLQSNPTTKTVHGGWNLVSDRKLGVSSSDV